MKALLVACMALLTSTPSLADGSKASADELVKKLSFASLRVRGAVISAAVAHEVRRSPTPRASAEKILRGWITPQWAHDAFMSTSYLTLSHHFFGAHFRIVRVREGKLSHKSRPAQCAASERLAIDAWWGETVQVCPKDYQPEIVSYQENACTWEGATGDHCGCGPALLHCAPEPLIQTFEEAADRERKAFTKQALFDKGGSPADVLTATKTLRNGVVDALYLRRWLLGELQRAEGPSQRQTVAKKALARLPRLLKQKDKWRVAARPGLEGTGMYLTSALGGLDTYRNGMRFLVNEFLCSEFKSVTVTTETLLHATKDEHLHLRTLSLANSPMAKTPGCKECHVPMDKGAGFLAKMTPLSAALLSGVNETGRFYVTNSKDFRGEGRGMKSFMNMVVSQPEFWTCVVERTSQAAQVSMPGQSDVEALGASLKEGTMTWTDLVVSLFLR